MAGFREEGEDEADAAAGWGSNTLARLSSRKLAAENSAAAIQRTRDSCKFTTRSFRLSIYVRFVDRSFGSFATLRHSRDSFIFFTLSPESGILNLRLHRFVIYFTSTQSLGIDKVLAK